VVHGSDNIEFELAVGAGLEDSRVDFDFLDAGPVELLEGCDNAGFLTGARGAVDEEVWEVAGLCLRWLGERFKMLENKCVRGL
jgi:hypothetical protein